MGVTFVEHEVLRFAQDDTNLYLCSSRSFASLRMTLLHWVGWGVGDGGHRLFVM
jgi:hypothetical protein